MVHGERGDSCRRKGRQKCRTLIDGLFLDLGCLFRCYYFTSDLLVRRFRYLVFAAFENCDRSIEGLGRRFFCTFFVDRLDREQPKSIRIKIQGKTDEVAELFERGIIGKPVSPRLYLQPCAKRCFGFLRSRAFVVRIDFHDPEYSPRSRQIQQVTFVDVQSGRKKCGRCLDDPEAVRRARRQAGRDLTAAEAEAHRLVTFTPDEIDWDDEVRLALEERAGFSPDALTGMEASLRCPGPETMESRIFGRLTAWQNWIFQRPNAVGERGALTLYGSGARADFDRRRV